MIAIMLRWTSLTMMWMETCRETVVSETIDNDVDVWE